jgi:5'-nucleotidase
MPCILLTNDDGIAARGLEVLANELASVAQLTVVAPANERSGAAHSISVRRPVGCQLLGEGRWAVDGTPADAVIIALHKLLAEPPDLVVSGINLGGNTGQNVHYSGTVGAAMEATVNRIPAFALSIASRNPQCDCRPAARLGLELARLLLEERLPEGVLLNVNVPEGWNGHVRFTRQSQAITRSLVREEAGPSGPVFWLQESGELDPLEPDSDSAALQAAEATVTPLYMDRTHLPSLNHLSRLVARLESLPSLRRYR